MQGTTCNRSPLGAILAGGISRRFGAPKALASVGGRRIIDRVRSALASAVDDLVIVANEPALFADLHLPIRADLHPGLGALAGVETALRRAMDLGRPGTLCVACDLPFVPADLLRVIVYRASKTDGDAVVPESTGRRGIEPLCAWYSVDALPAAERALASGDRSMASFVASVRAERISLDHVRRFGDPDILFLNVNTREDLARAESHASTEDGRS